MKTKTMISCGLIALGLCSWAIINQPKPKERMGKRGIERLLNKGDATTVPYTDYVVVCKKSEYELYKPVGKKYIRAKDIRYFEDLK